MESRGPPTAWADKDAPCYDGKQAEVVAQWREGMQKLAKDCPNVIMKVGGWGLPFLGTGFSTAAKPPTSKQVPPRDVPPPCDDVRGPPVTATRPGGGRVAGLSTSECRRAGVRRVPGHLPRDDQDVRLRPLHA